MTEKYIPHVPNVGLVVSCNPINDMLNSSLTILAWVLLTVILANLLMHHFLTMQQCKKKKKEHAVVIVVKLL